MLAIEYMVGIGVSEKGCVTIQRISIVIRRDATVVVGVRPVGYPPSLPCGGGGGGGVIGPPDELIQLTKAPGEGGFLGLEFSAKRETWESSEHSGETWQTPEYNYYYVEFKRMAVQ
jgi:hypothetical protein